MTRIVSLLLLICRFLCVICNSLCVHSIVSAILSQNTALFRMATVHKKIWLATRNTLHCIALHCIASHHNAAVQRGATLVSATLLVWCRWCLPGHVSNEALIKEFICNKRLQIWRIKSTPLLRHTPRNIESNRLLADYCTQSTSVTSQRITNKLHHPKSHIYYPHTFL